MLLFNLPFMGVRTSLWCNELINRYNFTDIPEKKKMNIIQPPNQLLPENETFTRAGTEK